MKGLSKKQAANFLLPHVGVSERPDSAAKLSCALLALYAGCGKKIVETYYPLEELVQMGYAEQKGNRWTLSALAHKHLQVEESRGTPNPHLKRLLGVFENLLRERGIQNFSAIVNWDEEEWKRSMAAMRFIWRKAQFSPHLKDDHSPETIARYIERVLNGMVYSEGQDYEYFDDGCWDIWTIARSFFKYMRDMRSIQRNRDNDKKKGTPVERPSATGRTRL